jgi:hypothetical protein
MPKYVAVSPSGDLVFNTDTQDHFFKSKKATMQGIQDELDEPAHEDGEGNVFSFGDEEGWTAKDYRIFKEV